MSLTKFSPSRLDLSTFPTPGPAPLPPLGHFSVTVLPSTHLPKLETYWYSLSPPTPSLSLSPLIHSALRYLVRNPFCCSAPPSGTQTSSLSASPSWPTWLPPCACCLTFTRWLPQVQASWLCANLEGRGGSSCSDLFYQESKSRFPLNSLAGTCVLWSLLTVREAGNIFFQALGLGGSGEWSCPGHRCS